jgi:glycosyltransferase involved in cell wall biosynthesis
MTEKTRITHVITGLATGGAETMLLKLLSGMDDSQFENSVISLTDAGPIGYLIRDIGVPVTVLGMNRSFPKPWDFIRLCLQIRRHKPHIVQTWLYHADLLGYFAAKLTSVKSISWNIRCSYMGKEYYNGMSGLVLKMLAAISAKPDTVIVNSTAGQVLHQSLGYTPKNWQIIPNCFDLGVFKLSIIDRQRIRKELEISEDVPVIGLVGRWDPIKGHALFLNAAKTFLAQRPESQFILVGNGCEDNNPDLIDLVPDELKANLHLLGERNDIPAVTASFDLAVCASIGEGFPNVLGEAMACQVPCVATDVGDCADIISDTGRIVASGDEVAMANAWSELLDLPPIELAALGAKARSRVSEFYSVQKVINAYQDLYLALQRSQENGISVTSR